MGVGPVMLLVTMIGVPLFIILWNRQRCKGKMLCFLLRKDKSVLGKLCELRDAFVLYQHRAYDVYPDLVRITRFPMGWPAVFQELVPSCLYDEENAIPLDWITLETPKEEFRSMHVRSALDENWLRKLVEEASKEGPGGLSLNWRKILPIALLVIGVVGLAIMLFMKFRGGG